MKTLDRTRSWISCWLMWSITPKLKLVTEEHPPFGTAYGRLPKMPLARCDHIDAQEQVRDAVRHHAVPQVAGPQHQQRD